MFAELFATYFVAHHIADYWIQTDHQANHKGDRGEHVWRGRIACLDHVIGHVIVTGLLVVILVLVTGTHPTVLGGLVGVGIIAVSHYAIDRRFTLRWVADKWPGNKVAYYDHGGAVHLDQAAHMLFLLVAALFATALS